MNLKELSKKARELKINYDELKKHKKMYSLSKKELQNFIDNIIELIETYESIYGEVYVLIDSLSGGDKISAQNLYANCNIYIRHLNPKLSKAENFLNQKNNNSAIRRDIWILIASIIFGIVLSIFTPNVQNYLHQNQNSKLENQLDSIRNILIENLETNETIEKNVDSLFLIANQLRLQINTMISE